MGLFYIYKWDKWNKWDKWKKLNKQAGAKLGQAQVHERFKLLLVVWIDTLAE